MAKFHAVMARALIEYGIDRMFGLIGDGNLFMVNEFDSHPEASYVGLPHEASAVMAAAGYSEISGGVGVATVTHGPALTNTLTALVEAARGRRKLLLIAGDTAAADRVHLQSIDQREVVATAGAGFVQVRTPESMLEDLAEALRLVHVTHSAVVLNVPADFMWTEIDFAPVPVAAPLRRQHPDPEAVDTALGLIASARRPVVVVGRGVDSQDAARAVQGFAERIGAPVTTTVLGKYQFPDDPFDLGICGTVASALASEIISGADCVIAFGASLNHKTTMSGSLFSERSVVHVDVDPEAIGRYQPVQVGVVGDAAVVAAMFVSQFDEAEVAPSGHRSDELRGRLKQARSETPPDRSTDRTVDVLTALRAIDQAVDADRSLVLDAGRFSLAVWPLVSSRRGGYVHTLAFGSIGLGMAHAIGAAVAEPGTATLMIAGDGGFMMGGLADFNTAVRYGLDIIVVLVNDSSYGAEHVQFRRREMDPSLTIFQWPDFASVARALGGDGFTISSLADLDGLQQIIRDRRGPILIDMKIDPDLMPQRH